MEKKIVPIIGLHCRSCEILVEDELSKIPGVTQVEVNQKKGRAIIYSSKQIDDINIEKAVTNAGYTLGYDVVKPWLSSNIADYIYVLIYGVIIIVLYFIAKEIGLFNLLLKTSNNFYSLSIVFLVGITAGLSTCMALVGGLVLGISARFAEKHINVSPLQKFTPHLFFNIGRVISYFVLGSVIGYAGSFFQLSPLILGILIILVGIIMLIVGLQLTELFPRLSTINITLPKGISRIFGIQEHSQKEYSHKNSFILGALTFFVPCGFTQAMQLFAISSGNAITGALTMGIFALGTTFGLLGIGGITSIIKGTVAKTFFKFAGIIVVFLAIFNITNGFNLAGININLISLLKSNSTNTNEQNINIEKGKQIVRMEQNTTGYVPNIFTIKKNIPVKWIINSTNPYSCASSIVLAKLGIRRSLQEGENIIEFTPTETGEISFSCSMGMYSGVFNVVEN
jgi:uncharacterized protein